MAALAQSGPDGGHIVLVMPMFAVGGVEQLAMRLVKSTAFRRHPIEVVCLEPARGPVFEELKTLDLTVVVVKGKLALIRHMLTRKWPVGTIGFGFMTTPNFLGSILCRVRGIPFVASVQLFPSAFERETWKHRLFRRSIYRIFHRLCRRTICVSNGVLEEVERLVGTRERLVMIHNPIEGEQDRSAREAPVLDFPLPAKPFVTACGRIVHQKGFDLLVEAMSRLPESQRGTPLVIIGDGPLRPQLEAQIREMGLEGSVHITGFVTNPSAIMAKGRVFVLSSRYEGLGMVLSEALATGTACVSFDCPSGPSDILQGGRFGHLAPAGDVDGLANAISRALVEPPCRDREAMADHLRTFDPEWAGERWIEAAQA
jgi:glycosyltransferase involved in cell wall biosynthesis